jgi:hypothetical protein
MLEITRNSLLEVIMAAAVTVTDFIVGRSYRVEVRQQTYPVLQKDEDHNLIDTGKVETVQPEPRKFKVLKYLSGSHKQFIEVFNLDKKTTSLFYVPNAKKITPL